MNCVLKSTFGASQLPTGTAYQINNETMAYLCGHSVVFYNFTQQTTVSTLILGENIICVRALDFYNNGLNMLSCEERPEGACVSVYERNSSSLVYQLKHRIFIIINENNVDKRLDRIITAKFISDTRILVISGAPKQLCIIYDNDQKTTALPTFTLKMLMDNVFNANKDDKGRIISDQVDPQRVKLLCFSEKDLLLIADDTVRFIRLGPSSMKINEPNGMKERQKYIYTDALFLNRELKKKYPQIPTESDQLIFLSTMQGVIVVLFKTSVVGEFRCDQYGFHPHAIYQMAIVNDPTVFIQKQENVTKSLLKNIDDDNPARSNQFFSSAYEQLVSQKGQERASCFLVIFMENGIVGFFSIFASVFFYFVAKTIQNQQQWESGFKVNDLFEFIMCYNTKYLIDMLLGRMTAPFDLTSGYLSKCERYLVMFGRNENQKSFLGMKMTLIVKRLLEIDTMRASYKARGKNYDQFRQDLITILTEQGEEVKRLISQDQLTILKGEVLHLKDMEVNINNINLTTLDNEECLDQTLAYDFYKNQEVWLLQPLHSANQITSISSSQTTSQLAILTNDRIVRIFDQTNLKEQTYHKFSDVADRVFYHPSGQYLALAGTSQITLCQAYVDRLVNLHQFKVDFCKMVAFSQSGDTILAVSGSHLKIFDFSTRESRGEIQDFSGRIMSVVPLVRDFSGSYFDEQFMISTADGGAVLLDCCSMNKVYTTTIKQVHIEHMCPMSIGWFLNQSGDDIKNIRLALIFCIMSDWSIRVLDSKMNQRGQLKLNQQDDNLTQRTVALIKNELRGNASNDVVCPINDGKINLTQVFKGRPTMLLVVQQFLLIAYELGYVVIKNISTLLKDCVMDEQRYKQVSTGDKTHAVVPLCEKTEELVLSFSGSFITGLQALVDNTGFVVATDDGCVYSVNFQQVQQFKIISEKADVTDFQPINVLVSQYNYIINQIHHQKNVIYSTKKNLVRKIDQLSKMFQDSKNSLEQQTNNHLSAHLSEQERLRQEHESKTVLLRRQIANNTNLFNDSKRALEMQYQKRITILDSNLAELQNNKHQTQERLEMEIAQSEQNFRNDLQEYSSQREVEKQDIQEKIDVADTKFRTFQQSKDLFYKLSEDQMYAESDGMRAQFSSIMSEHDRQIQDLTAINIKINQDYQELTAKLTNQRIELSKREKLIDEKKQEIQLCKKDIQNIKNEIQNRDLTISQREKRVIELNQKIRELNKISFILQFKIRELKRTIQPKEQELAELKEKLKEMNSELSQYRLNLASLQAAKKDLQSKSQSLNKQIEGCDSDRLTAQRKLDEVRLVVNGLLDQLKQHDDLFRQEAEAQRLLPSLQMQGGQDRRSTHRKTVTQEELFVPVDRNIQYRQVVNWIKKIHECLTSKPNKLIQQRTKDEEDGNFSKLESNVVQLQQKVSSQMTQKKSSTSGVMAQNALLLQEINQLRRELHQAQVQANTDYNIDEALLNQYQAHREEILRLRAVIRNKERAARVGGQFLPTLNAEQ